MACNSVIVFFCTDLARLNTQNYACARHFLHVLVSIGYIFGIIFIWNMPRSTRLYPVPDNASNRSKKPQMHFCAAWLLHNWSHGPRIFATTLHAGFRWGFSADYEDLEQFTKDSLMGFISGSTSSHQRKFAKKQFSLLSLIRFYCARFFAI